MPTHNSYNQQLNISEGMEQDDLKRLVHPELHIDEFQSKLGDDEDIIVLSFKVTNKEPAQDLMSFIEKGYDWVIDADTSAGEMNDGSYIVFVEIDRSPEAVTNIMDLMDDLMNLTGQKLHDWRVRYYKSRTEKPLSAEALKTLIPLTADSYNKLYGHNEIDNLKTAAGLPVNTKAPKNEYTESLRALAGII